MDIRGPEVCWVDEQTGLEFRWNRAHSVNVFDVEGNNVDVFTVGSFELDAASESEVFDAIKRYLDEQYKDWESE